ncbi:MAG TPA: radical SAM protein [Candidatus Nanoarchaeia archaeon]|nr:radical SAM protein [Candidatus Nanoarchaeia archaeon]
MDQFQLKEIQSKSILTKSGLPGADYVINPYVGCMHACPYCYAVFMKRVTKHKEPWGKFVDVKMNAPELLEKEIKKAKKGLVLMSSVTDAYHPLEIRYKLTRRLLEILLKYQFPISVLTKSDLVTRDIDVLKRFKSCEVGFSFLSFNDQHRKDFEPVAASPERRLEAMKKLKKAGIKVYAFMGPIFPYLTNIEEMLKKFKELGVDMVWAENLNHKAGTWPQVFEIIQKKYPGLAKEYERIFFTKNDYWDKVEARIKKKVKELKLKVRIVFHHQKYSKTKA